ncbi:hypothetical protein BDV29DRAFT_182024 [Aspergillus leporis]|uniref:Uncharacterized protein n=1 Tax=Aspergillus leporis TaxID=41062 RepID=A0A5N5WMS4_9EURO|nr:hypothetical protein BDV29DRAFT_182024 [Aspergillus leporis]
MEGSNRNSYIALLEQRIQQLLYVVQAWKPYVPENIVQQSTAWQPILPKSLPLQPPSHQPPTFQLQQKRQLLLEPAKHEESWKKQLKAYINKVPTAERWSEAVTVPSPSLLELIFQTDSLSLSAKTLNEGIQQSSSIISIVEGYSLLTESVTQNAKQFKLFASFMKFLFCCICHVACCVGTSPQEVNSKMIKIAKGKPEYLEELRHGVAWQMKATDLLHINGHWGMRSGDITFHFPPTFKCLRSCAKSTAAVGLFVDSLSDKKYTEGKEDDPGMNLSIPCILKCIFGKTARLEVICTSCHCNFQLAQSIFTRCYMELYGLHALDDQEKRSFCFPVAPALSTPGHSPARSDFNYDPSQQDHARSQKRRRTNDNAVNAVPGFFELPRVGEEYNRLESQSIQGTETTLRLGCGPSITDHQRQNSPSLRQEAPQALSPNTSSLSSPKGSLETEKASQRRRSNNAPLYLTDTMETTESEDSLLAVPSFIPMSSIPSLSSADDTSRQTAGLPSSPLNAYIPSFSQITGIPSP